MRRAVALAGLLLATGLQAAPAGAGAGGAPVHHTYPQPPRAKPADPLRVAPGQQVPEHPEFYTWRITNKMPNGKVIYQQSVPLYLLSDNARPFPKGEVAVGTVVKLDYVMRVGRTIYYQMPAADADPAKPVLDPDKMRWINGNFIEPAAFNPPKGYSPN